MNRISLIVIVAAQLLAAQLFAQKLTASDLKKLAGTMAGEYSSEAQAKADTNYFHIMLRMKPIWKDNPDGFWFYVEQSVATAQQKPYRQRVYHLYLNDDTTIVSKVYEIKNPLKYTLGWKESGKLAGLTPDSLVDRQGCGIYLHKRSSGTFTGSTPGKECLSSLRGATYATSEVAVYSDKLVSWDRGWNKEDKQVWGAEKGGYIFIKQKRLKY
jgi:hypothetical protein